MFDACFIHFTNSLFMQMTEEHPAPPLQIILVLLLTNVSDSVLFSVRCTECPCANLIS